MEDVLLSPEDLAEAASASRPDLGFIFVILLAVCTGYLSMAVMPLWTEGVLRSTGAPEALVLLCGSVELGGGALAALAYARWGLTRRVSGMVRLAAIVILTANLISVAIIVSGHFSLAGFAFARLTAGAGIGTLLAAANARITRTAFAERLFIAAHFGFGLFAAGTFQLLPPFMAQAEGRAMSTAVPVLLFSAGMAVLMLALAGLTDSNDMIRPKSGARRHRLAGRDWLQLLMLMLFFSGFNSIYSYWERFGAHAGVSREFVAHMLSMGNLTALIGLSIALLAANRIGVKAPIILCLTVLALSAWVSSNGGLVPPPLGHRLFGAAILADQTCAIVVVPFVLTLMAMQDRRGSVAAAAPSAMNVGNVLGPTVAVAVGRVGYASIGWTAIGFYLAGFIVLLFISRRRPTGHAAMSREA